MSNAAAVVFCALRVRVCIIILYGVYSRKPQLLLLSDRVRLPFTGLGALVVKPTFLSARINLSNFNYVFIYIRTIKKQNDIIIRIIYSN